MKIVHKQDALRISKPEGIDVSYYLFNEYEIHYNEQAPHTTQSWHHHEKIWETLYIIEGELIAKWREGQNEKEMVVHKGDIIETERTPHTFENRTDNVVRFLVFKHIPKGEDLSAVLKSDKILD